MSNVTYPQPATTGGKHPVNILHLVMGVIFLGVVSIWALIQGEIASTEDLRWLIPLPWVIAGAAGLIVIVMSRGSEPSGAAPIYEYAAEPVPAPDYTSDLEAKLEAEAPSELDEGTDPEATPDR